jgi:AcrR family transcriptional regulator
MPSFDSWLRSTTVPRAGLNESRVVDEAERMADEVGYANLTMASLAARLGVRQPSLYKHIAGMDALRRSIAIRAKLELATILSRAAVGRSRADAILAMSHAYRAWAHEHPGRYAAAQGAPVPSDIEDHAASSAAVQVVADVMSGFELSGDAAIDAIRSLRSALHGFVSLEAAGGFGLSVDIDRSFDRLVNGMAAAFSMNQAMT